MHVRPVPQGFGRRTAAIQFHPHVGFRTALPREQIRGGWLFDFTRPGQYFFTRRAAGGDVDDHAPLFHADVFQLRVQHVARVHHAFKHAAKGMNPRRVVVASVFLHHSSSIRGASHAVVVLQCSSCVSRQIHCKSSEIPERIGI